MKYEQTFIIGTATQTGADFPYCKFTSINLPEHLTSIGKAAFMGCSALTSIIIPKGVTEIEDFTFMSCVKLAYVTIPENVTSIGNSSFLACDNIMYVNVKAKTPPTISIMTFANHAKPTLSVPLGCKATYESTQYWNEFKEIIEE